MLNVHFDVSNGSHVLLYDESQLETLYNKTLGLSINVLGGPLTETNVRVLRTSIFEIFLSISILEVV